ncbi:hypothetical protein FB451DRAFT_399999 [Mycena latifolia]|nr:hypothetical protein FB451DRAFT_399999 [Mycena latifolia]
MSSPFTSKLGTNYCPQDEEIVEIQSLLTGPSLRLKELEDEIADLQKALSKRAEERTELSAYVDAHMALISPVRRLPLDVIQEIFVACLPTHRNCVMSAVEAPVLLGRICSSWRSISLSTPRLWSRLHIVEPRCPYDSALPLFEGKLAQRLEVTKMWLGRSGNCPLSISLHCTSFILDNLTSSTQHRLLQALLPFTSRWEHIAFTAPSSVLETMSHLIEADVPILQSVSLNEILQHRDNLVGWVSLGLLGGPKVDSVHITGNSFSPLELPLRWAHLTELSMWLKLRRATGRSLTSEMTLQLLSRCPQLQTCRFRVRDGPEPSIGVEGPILELSFLHTLDLNCRTLSSTVHQLLGRVSLPQLRSLTLRGRSDSDNISFAPFLAATPRLEILDLSIELFSKSSLADFFRGLPPTIREIEISSTFSGGSSFHGEIFDAEIFESLIPAPDVSNVCFPELQALEIKFLCSVSDAAIIRFIKLRTLKRVVMSLNRGMELDIRSELQSFLQSGLRLELTYSPPVLFYSPWDGLADAPNPLHPTWMAAP